MRIRSMLVAAVIAVLAGTLPVAAQMMGGQAAGGMGGMMGGMGPGMHSGGDMPTEGAAGCPGVAGDPAAFVSSGPWISFALAHASDLGLAPDQVRALTTIRDDFGLQVRQGADPGIVRAQAMQQASAVLDDTQRARLEELARSMREMHQGMHQGGGGMHQDTTGGAPPATR